MRDLRRAIPLALAMLVFGASLAAAAAPPGRKCQSAKNQEAGKYAACLSKAEAKLVATAGTCSVTTATECYADDDCPMGESCTKDLTKYGATVAKCQTKFTAKWDALTQKASAAGDSCPDGLASTDIQDAVDAHVANVAAGLAGDGLSSGSDDCGNGGIDAGEDCDLGNLNGGTCASEGFGGGELRCGAGCVYDTSECYAARFVDNANGTITDNDTGLTWEKKVKLNSTPDLANLQDADNVYRWSGICEGGDYEACQPDAASEAACLAGVEGNNYGCAQCVSGFCDVFGVTVWEWLVALNDVGFGGHNDWRLATKSEYLTIIDETDVTPPVVNVAFHGASCGVACTDVTNPACSCTSGSSWSASASTVAPSSAFAWAVNFFDGSASKISKEPYDNLSVRAVRGGS